MSSMIVIGFYFFFTSVSNMFDLGDNAAMRDLVVALVDAGADVNKYDAEKWTPLYQAASAGDLGTGVFLYLLM